MPVLAVLLLLLMAACQPAAPSPEPQAESSLESPTSTSDPGGVPLDPGGVPLNPGAPQATESFEAPLPPLIWVPLAEFTPITGSFCCGFTTPEFIRNYLPDFEIRGDGSYRWVEYAEGGSRQVMQAQLTQDEIGEILSGLATAGFFGWKDRYANDFIADYADKCITVRLLEVEKQVCEYYEGAPEAFHTLFADLSRGAGREGEEFIPESGLLQLTRFDVDFVTPQLAWDDDSLALSAIPPEGLTISGPALETLWRTLNQAPWGPVVEEAGVYYIYTIQLLP